MAITKVSRGLLSTGIVDNSNATAITIDSSEKVGIGNASPEQILHIKDTSNPGTTTGSVIIEGQRDGTANLLELRARDNSSPSSALPNAQGGIIRCTGFDGTDFEELASIKFQADGQAVANGDAPGRLVFGTTADTDGSATERMRIDSSGNVGIGTASPSTPLHAATGSNGSGLVDVARFQNTGTSVSDGARIQLTAGTSTSGAGIGCLGVALNSAHLVFHAGGNTERMRLLSSGGLTFNGDTAAANALDDYEEGTWQPQIKNITSMDLVQNTTYNWYVKIGRFVSLSAYIKFDAASSETSAIEIDNLPFATDSATAVAGSMISRYSGTRSSIAPYINGTFISFYKVNNSGSWDQVAYDEVGQFETHMSISYFTT